MNTENAVLERYSHAAKEREPTLCCPAPDYDPSLLEKLPQEIIDKDYGCGDPSRYVRPGDTVLDLGSGGGKICYLAAQLVGEQGRVIGVDMNDEMLALARKYQAEMAAAIGSDRVRFVKASIQDLAIDLEALDAYLITHPIRSESDYRVFESWQIKQRHEHPLIADQSIDLVISNCVLNLVQEEHKDQLVREIHRVLRPGGHVAISDIVSDESVPQALKTDPDLWSGCISGAFQEQELLASFSTAGFLAARYDKWDAAPWRVIDGIEFRSVTLTAVKGEGIPCLDVGQAVIYRGPFASVTDDEGHIFPRGERMAVCERTYRLLTEGPYRQDFIGISPGSPRDPVPWCAPAGTRRPTADTKGATHQDAGTTSGCC